MAKKYFSKALSVGLSLALCAGMIAPAFAASFSELNEAINSNENRTFGENNDITASTDENGVRNVTLNGDVTRTDASEGAITVAGGEVTLNMNGNKIDGAGKSGSVIAVSGEGTKLTINADAKDEEGNVTKVGEITGGKNSTFGDTYYPNGGGIQVSSDASLEMNGGKVHKNEADCGGGIYVDGNFGEDTSAVLNGVEICDNVALNVGGGVDVNNASAELKNVYIHDNKAAAGAGMGVYNGTATLDHSSITKNTAENGGGGIAAESMKYQWNSEGAEDPYYRNDTTVTLQNGTIVKDNIGWGEANDVYAWAYKDSTTTIIGDPTAKLEDGRVFEGWYNDWDKPESLPQNASVTEAYNNWTSSWKEAEPEQPSEPSTPPVTPVTEIDEPAVPLAAGPVTRAEFIDYLWRHEDAPESAGVCTFTDVGDTHEYFDALCWAEENGIAEAYLNAEGHEDGTFEPDELVTVAAVREFLGNFARVFGMDVDVYALTTLTGDDDEAVLNCDEVLAEFFGEEYTPARDEDEAA